MAKKINYKFASGLSITETLVSMVVIGLGVLGAMSLRYQSSLDSRRAEVGMNASRIALMMTETWHGAQGSTTFDPLTLLGSDLNIEASGGPAEPNNFTLLGKYQIELNNVSYYSTLSYKDINASLRALNVIVTWEQKGIKDADLDDSDKSFALTTYVEK